MRALTLGACALNQWAMDFNGNHERIRASIVEAKSKGCRYRLGPELETCGYGCEDHFHESDTEAHAWEIIARLCAEPGLLRGSGVVADVGAPATMDGCRYNARVIIVDGKIALVRPKRSLADDGNYRESRWFTAWTRTNETATWRLPDSCRGLAYDGGDEVPFGDGAVVFDDCGLGCETCEELWTPDAPHIALALNGIEIIANGSGSHHQLRKLDARMSLIQSASGKGGGIYLYANQRGCDGGRLYYDGCACIAVNGKIVAQGKQFDVSDVEVVVATVDLDEVRSYRNCFQSMSVQAAKVTPISKVRVHQRLCVPDDVGRLERPKLSATRDVQFHSPEEEIALGPACWLWDYLRRSGASGYFLPLSGGADSSSTAAIVGSMCQLVTKAAREGDEVVAMDIRRIAQLAPNAPIPSANELAELIFTTVYLGTDNSSAETRARAKALAIDIGASHLSVAIDVVVTAVVTFFTMVTGKTPKFKVDGGSNPENLALQNIQARVRMVLSFLFAQLLPWVRGKSGFLLVLGSANVDEGLRGYMTKYDCSSADINPIGGISKGDLRSFLRWGSVNLGYPTLAEVEQAPPTAELEPIRDDYVQTDEEDMGMSYDELGVYGRLRKIYRLGPFSMFKRLYIVDWADRGLSASEVAEKVKKFFFFYSCNRHKMTTLTPSYHAENYSPDDNRFDQRQFLYNVRWPWQFRKIDEFVAKEKEG
jgi:NAD+ synthase (glutamine-hydrolysing)